MPTSLLEPTVAEIAHRWRNADWDGSDAISPVQKSLLKQVTSWFAAVEEFRQLEFERLIEMDPTMEDLEGHNSLISILEVGGNRLREVVSVVGLPKSAKVGIAEIDATLGLIRDTKIEWHGSLHPDRKKQILDSVYGER